MKEVINQMKKQIEKLEEDKKEEDKKEESIANIDI